MVILAQHAGAVMQKERLDLPPIEECIQQATSSSADAYIVQTLSDKKQAVLRTVWSAD